MRDINLIVIHCSATPPDQKIGAEEIRDWHVNGNKWSDIGYHYVIRRNGVIDVGRDVSVAGAHAKGYNHGSIGICLVGGVDEENKPDANYTRMQWRSLSILVDDLVEEYDLQKVIGHRDISTKACPCFNVAEWYT